MTLKKKCPCCEKALTTKNVRRIGREFLGHAEMLYLNCKACESTVVICRRLESKGAA